jgi:hypothetical protein
MLVQQHFHQAKNPSLIDFQTVSEGFKLKLFNFVLLVSFHQTHIFLFTNAWIDFFLVDGGDSAHQFPVQTKHRHY